MTSPSSVAAECALGFPPADIHDCGPGLQPERLRIIVLKSTVHFRADLGSIAGEILIAKAPGPHLADNRD